MVKEFAVGVWKRRLNDLVQLMLGMMKFKICGNMHMLYADMSCIGKGSKLCR